MSKANDGARVTGTPEADHAASGRSDTARGGSSPSADGDPTRVEMPTRRQLRLQQVGGKAVAPSAEAEEAAAADALTAAGPRREPLPGGRRDRRRRQALPIDPADTGSRRADDGRDGASIPHGVQGMSIEEALATRRAIDEESRKHGAGLLAAGSDEPLTIDLDVLAHQRALAERATILNARVRRIQEVPEQSRQPGRPLHDPAAADNLSILAPPETIRVPGSTREALRAPMTSQIPVVVPRPQQAPAVPPIQRDERAGAGDPGVGGGTGIGPVGARSAFGLEPLDAMTAGLGRLRRVRYIQYSLLGLGAAALATGIIMTVSSLNG